MEIANRVILPWQRYTLQDALMSHMKRRQTIAGTIATIASLGGCVFLNSENYPDIPDGASPIDYSVHRIVPGERILDRTAGSKIGAIVTESDSDIFTEGWMNSSDRDFINSTDFSSSIIIAVQLITSEESSGLNIVEVVAENDTTIHSYSEVSNPSGNDDAFPSGILMRVSTNELEKVQTLNHTHRGGNTDADLTTEIG